MRRQKVARIVTAGFWLLLCLMSYAWGHSAKADLRYYEGWSNGRTTGWREARALWSVTCAETPTYIASGQ